MAIRDALLPEFDQETASTRRTLERVPGDRFDWSPHEKSGSMVWLAGHLANLPSWVGLTIGQDALDLAPGGKPPDPPPTPTSVDEILAAFDKNVTEARAAIAEASDEELMKPVVATSKRQDDDDAPQGRGAAELRDEPPDSSPSAAWCLSASERYPGTFHLRPVCRRKPDGYVVLVSVKAETHVDRDDEPSRLVVNAQRRVAPLHHRVDRRLVEWPDRPKNTNLLDAPLLVDGGLDHHGPFDAARNGIRWVRRLNAVNELRRGDAGTNTNRFPTGRRCPLPPTDTTLNPETRAGSLFRT